VGVDSELGMAGTLEAVVNARKDVLTIVAIAENKALAEKIDKALEGDAARLKDGVNAIIDYGVQFAQVRTGIGQKDNIDMNQVIFSGVGGSTGTALNRVLPETTGKVINDLPTIWTQISTSGVNTAIPIMLSK